MARHELLAWVLMAMVAVGSLDVDAQNANKKLVVCTKDTLPMSQCSEDGDPTSFSGYDVVLFRKAAERMGLKESVDYTFRCIALSGKPITDILVHSFADGSCDAFTGGITLSTERIDLGMNFSRPTYASSLGVLVSAQLDASDGWFFVKPFDWTVWLAIGVSLLVFPFLAYVVESLSLKGRLKHEDWRPGLRKSYWEVTWVSMQNGSSTVESSATRIMLLAYAAMAVVLLNCYVATLTTSLTVRRFQSTISTIAELRGKAVGSVAAYQDRLARNAILSRPYPSQRAQDLGRGGANDWITQLRTQSLLAFVYDEPLLRNIAIYTSNITGCDLRMLEQTFEPFDYAIAFPHNTTMDLATMDEMILRLQEDGTMDSLRETFMRLDQPRCSLVNDGGTSSGFSITFSQVWGVWVLFGGCMLIGLIVAAIIIPRRKKTMRRRQTANSIDASVLETAPSAPLSELSFSTAASNARLVQLSVQPGAGGEKSVTLEQVQRTFGIFVEQMRRMLARVEQSSRPEAQSIMV